MADTVHSSILGIQIIIPLLGGIICSFFKKPNISWLLCLLIIISMLGFTWELERELHNNSFLFYNMGGWQPPYGIQFQLNHLNLIILALVEVIALFSLLYGKTAVPAEIDSNKIPWFYACFLLCYTGLIGMILTNDAFNLYVFLEISSLSTYTLIALGKKEHSLYASFEYLIIGTLGATFYLIGLGFVYALVGSVNITDITIKATELHNNKALQVGIIFIIMGIAIKSALFPLHIWLTKAYCNAPSFFTVFLSGTATKVSIYILIKYIFYVFGTQFIFKQMHFDNLLIILSLSGIIFSSLYALTQKSLVQVLAYSSVAQIGYIVLAIGLNSPLSLTASLFNIVLHSLSKVSLFISAGTISNNNYFPTFHFFIAGANLIGIPLTGGFITKLYLLQAAADNNFWGVFFLIILGSFLTFLYVGKAFQTLYFKKYTDKIPFSTHLSLTLLSGLILIFGLFPSFLTQFIDQAINLI